MRSIIVLIVLLLMGCEHTRAQQEPAWFGVDWVQVWRTREQLEQYCKAHPAFRDCRNLDNPAWDPTTISPHCVPKRREIS